MRFRRLCSPRSSAVFSARASRAALTSVSVVGVGDRAALGASHLAHEGSAQARDHERAGGLARTGSPRGRRQDRGLHVAAGRPVAAHARHGRRSSGSADQDGAGHVRRSAPARAPAEPANAAGFRRGVELAGEEWLFFKPVPVKVAFLRGTTADEDGNVTMEEEAVLGEMLAMAQATRRAGGIVIVQVKRTARATRCRPST